jgi:hypothetical protein
LTNQPVFQRNIRPSSSGSKNKPSKKPAWTQVASRALRTTRRCIPEDRTLRPQLRFVSSPETILATSVPNLMLKCRSGRNAHLFSPVLSRAAGRCWALWSWSCVSSATVAIAAPARARSTGRRSPKSLLSTNRWVA